MDQLGKGPSELAIVVPISRSNPSPALDVEIAPPEGGLDSTSYAMPYQVRTVSRERLMTRRGSVRDITLTEVVTRVRILIRPPA